MNLYSLNHLVSLLRCLRDSDCGCAWIREQNYCTVAPFTLEEAYEVADVIEREAFDELSSELGDLLFHVVFFAQIAEEESRFNLSNVINDIVEKLLKRHPHVFPDGSFESFGRANQIDIARIKETWEDQKEVERFERGQFDLFDDVACALPSLCRAEKIQKRAARVGFDWSGVDGVYDKLEEEITELLEASGDSERELEEFGDLLFTTVGLARHLGIDSERALRLATLKFETRMQRVIEEADARTIELSGAPDSVKSELWMHAKRPK